jgi:hypothetical protein
MLCRRFPFMLGLVYEAALQDGTPVDRALDGPRCRCRTSALGHPCPLQGNVMSFREECFKRGRSIEVRTMTGL